MTQLSNYIPIASQDFFEQKTYYAMTFSVINPNSP